MSSRNVGRTILPSKSSAPASPVAGQIYYDTAAGVAYFYNGSNWVPMRSPVTVSSLPGSPYDGQEIYYVADATNGIVWHLKYRSASASSYKWEYVGGPPLVYNGNGVATAGNGTTSYTDQTGSLTAPVAGDYTMDFSAWVTCNLNPTWVNYSYHVGGTAASTLDNHGIQFQTTSYAWFGPFGKRNYHTSVAASTVFQTAIKSGTNGNTVYAQNTVMYLTPVRVG